jgi:hypothetical protein
MSLLFVVYGCCRALEFFIDSKVHEIPEVQNA